MLGRQRALALAGDRHLEPPFAPDYHGVYAAILAAVPALLLLILWAIIAPRIYDAIVAVALRRSARRRCRRFERADLHPRCARARRRAPCSASRRRRRQAAAELYQSLWSTGDLVLGVLLALLVAARPLLGLAHDLACRRRTRQFVERFVMGVLIACSVVAILTTVGIVLSLIFESLRFFQKVPFFDFLFGTHWSPQSAFEGAGAEARDDNREVFGAIPLFVGTLLITAIAMLVAAPIGLMSAIYLSDYASPRFRAFAKPVLEVLAGIPTVVYGFFAALTVAPFIRRARRGDRPQRRRRNRRSPPGWSWAS